MPERRFAGDVGKEILDGIEQTLTLTVLKERALCLKGVGTFSMMRLRAALETRKHLACIDIRGKIKHKLYIHIYNVGFEVKRVIQCGNYLASTRAAVIGEKDYLFIRIGKDCTNTKCDSLEQLAEVAGCAEVDAYVDHLITLKTARRIRKIKDYLKYAPGGPMMDVALSDFQSRAAFTG